MQPIVSFASIPAAILWAERRLQIARLPGNLMRAAGLPTLALGWGISAWCALTFVTLGGGTPDPNRPPQVLVQRGPYKYSRNPMVVGAMLGLAGLALSTRSTLLLLYVAALAPVVRFYHVRTEEPELVARFGQAYIDYQQRVPRWI